jgi:hypothetical protein
MQANRSVIYLDTSALNILCDTYKRKSTTALKRNYDILLSWPLLDEINSNSTYARTIDLAQFVWKTFNKNILLDVKSILDLELRHALKGYPLNGRLEYFDADIFHHRALGDARRGTTPLHIRKSLASLTAEHKKSFYLWEKVERDKWLSKFVSVTHLNNWSDVYDTLLEEKYFNQLLIGMTKIYGLNHIFDYDDIMRINHKSLPCISIGIELYIAMQFLISSHSKRLGKPNRGDIFDIKHSFYIGLVDYFVTDDSRFLYLLRNIMGLKHSVIPTQEFISMIRDVDDKGD